MDVKNLTKVGRRCFPLLLFLIFLSTLASASYWNFLTIGQGDQRYCLVNGDCILSSLILDNLTIKGNFLNVTVINYNVTGNAKFEGNLSAEDVCIAGGRCISNVDTNASTECNDGDYLDGSSECIDFNATVEKLLEPTFFNVTNITTVLGTLDDGNVLSVQEPNDGLFYNVSEAGGVEAFLIQANFSNVTNFNNMIFREWYQGGSGHIIDICLWHYTDDDWDCEHGFITDMDTYAFTIVNVVDPENHINEGLVQMKFDHVGNGNPAHEFSLDYLTLVKGATTVSPEEVDPLAIHKTGDVAWEGNEDGGGFNTTNWNYFCDSLDFCYNLSVMNKSISEITDTNASTACSTGEVLGGNTDGCISTSTLGNSSFNVTLTDELYAKYEFTNNNFNGTGNFTTTGIGTFGSLIVDTDTLFVDSINKRVGVGTIIPGRDFSIVGSGTTFFQITNTALGATSGNGFEIFVTTAGGGGIINRESGNLELRSGGSISINSGGNLNLNPSTGLIVFKDSGTTAAFFKSDTSNTQELIAVKDVVGNQFILTNDGNSGRNHDHTTQTDPTFYVHSDTNPDTDNTQWISLTHNKINGIINTGTGTISFVDNNLITTGELEIDKIAVGSNNIGGLSPGDINVSTLFYDLLDEKSPMIHCSDDWCEVRFPKYQKNLWLQRNDNFTILDIIYEDVHYTKQTFYDLVQGTQYEELALKLNKKIKMLQDKKQVEILLKQQKEACQYEWDNECFEIIRTNSTYNNSVEIVEIPEIINVVDSCIRLDFILRVEIYKCNKEVETGNMINVTKFRKGCNWNVEEGYYCEIRELR